MDKTCTDNNYEIVIALFDINNADYIDGTFYEFCAISE